jgi:hypothetical protein
MPPVLAREETGVTWVKDKWLTVALAAAIFLGNALLTLGFMRVDPPPGSDDVRFEFETGVSAAIICLLFWRARRPV